MIRDGHAGFRFFTFFPFGATMMVLAVAYMLVARRWLPGKRLTGRVEAVVPIEPRPSRERPWRILNVMRRDRRQAWVMDADGAYRQLEPGDDRDLGTHATLMNLARAEAVVSPEELDLLR